MWCTCGRIITISKFHTILRFDFSYVLTVWYLLFFILLHKSLKKKCTNLLESHIWPQGIGFNRSPYMIDWSWLNSVCVTRSNAHLLRTLSKWLYKYFVGCTRTNSFTCSMSKWTQICKSINHIIIRSLRGTLTFFKMYCKFLVCKKKC